MAGASQSAIPKPAELAEAVRLAREAARAELASTGTRGELSAEREGVAGSTKGASGSILPADQLTSMESGGTRRCVGGGGGSGGCEGSGGAEYGDGHGGDCCGVDGGGGSVDPEHINRESETAARLNLLALADENSVWDAPV